MADLKLSLTDFQKAPSYEEDVAITQGGQQNPPSAGMQETGVKISADEYHKSPIELLTPEQLSTITRSGLSTDKKPILDVQNLDDTKRWKTILFFDTPEERINYLKDDLPDYEFSTNPQKSSEVILRKKGTKYWGKIDPGYDNDSLLKELGENLDSVAQSVALPASMLSGALAAGTIEGARQFIKTQLDDEAKASLGMVGVSTLAGGLSIAPLAVGSSTVKASVKKAASTVQNEATKRGITLEKAGNLFKNFVDNPEYIAQNLGANTSNFKKGIERNISYLQDNAKDVMSAIQKAPTLKKKKAAIESALNEAGQQLDAFYGNPDNIVSVANIFDSNAFNLLDEAVGAGRIKAGGVKGKDIIVSERTRGAAYDIQRDLITRVARTSMPDDDKYLKAYMRGSLRRLPELKPMKFKTDNEAMLAILKQSDLDLSAADARAIHDGFANALKFGKQKKQIKDKDDLYKYALDSITDAVQATAEETGDTTLASANKLFNNLIPIDNLVSDSIAAAKTERFNFTKFVPSALNGIKRQSLLIATKLADRPEIRSALYKMGNVSEQGFEDAVTSGGRSKIGKLIQGMSFTGMREIGEKQLLPRDTQAYFKDPSTIQALISEVDDPELTDSLVGAYDRGDSETFSNVLSMAASGNEALFESTPYKSLVMNNGKPTIMDKYEREQYRKFLEKTVTDPRDLFDALQALNGDNVMTTKPFEPPAGYMEIKKGKATPAVTKGKVSLDSSISKTADSLRKSDTVRFKDGTERKDYSY